MAHSPWSLASYLVAGWFLKVCPSWKGQSFVLTSVGTYSGYGFAFSACSASVKILIQEPTECLFPIMVFHITLCCREKPIPTSWWSCSFDLLSVAFVIIIIQNGLPQRILPVCLTVKLKWLCLEPCPPVDDRKEEKNTSPAWGLHSRRCLQD